MKNKLGIFTIVVLLSPFTIAADEPTALVSKWSGTGYTLPEAGRGDLCEVFKDRVKISRALGHDQSAITVVETRTIQLEGDITAVLTAAAQEKEETKDNFLCD